MGQGLTGRLRGTRTPPAAGPGVVVVEVALPPEEVKKLRRWLMIAGILAILGGAAAIAIPALASVAITLFIGWFLVATGIVMTVHAFQMRSRAQFPLRLLTGLLTVLTG